MASKWFPLDSEQKLKQLCREIKGQQGVKVEEVTKALRVVPRNKSAWFCKEVLESSAKVARKDLILGIVRSFDIGCATRSVNSALLRGVLFSQGKSVDMGMLAFIVNEVGVNVNAFVSLDGSHLNQRTPLAHGILEDNYTLVKALIVEFGADVNIVNRNGRIPLHIALDHDRG